MSGAVLQLWNDSNLLSAFRGVFLHNDLRLCIEMKHKVLSAEMKLGKAFGQLIEVWISKMPVNWIFAFGVRIWFLDPINRFLCRTICKKQLQTA